MEGDKITILSPIILFFFLKYDEKIVVLFF